MIVPNNLTQLTFPSLLILFKHVAKCILAIFKYQICLCCMIEAYLKSMADKDDIIITVLLTTELILKKSHLYGCVSSNILTKSLSRQLYFLYRSSIYYDTMVAHTQNIHNGKIQDLGKIWGQEQSPLSIISYNSL